MITSDGAVVEVGADIFFRVTDPVLSVSTVQDLNHSLRIIAVASLQKHLSKLRLNHIETDKGVTSSLLHVSSVLECSFVLKFPSTNKDKGASYRGHGPCVSDKTLRSLTRHNAQEQEDGICVSLPCPCSPCVSISVFC